MNRVKLIARVILRSDGSVHICFEDIRSIYATPENIIELFSDPIEFINTSSHTYKESTILINRKRVAIDDVLGLTLCTVDSDKRISCDFPELFQFVCAEKMTDKERKTHINMKSLELQTVFSDEKSFLLKYYLEFTGNLREMPVIKENLGLRNEVQTQIIREILNTYLEEELPAAKKAADLTTKIKAAEADLVYKNETQQETEKNMISSIEYAKKLGVSITTVYTLIKTKRLKSATLVNGRWMVDKNEIPEKWNLHIGKKKRNVERRKKYGSAADVAEHIKKHGYFSDIVAENIHTFEEMDYYTRRSYHEFLWDGRLVLAIDINPDYINSKTGISNRQLMKEGNAPCIPDPGKEDYCWHVHHLAQRDVVFAVLPEYDHNSKTYSKYFHHGAPIEDLHGPEFEAQKANLWKKYLEEYDKAQEKFEMIPFNNHWKKRKNRK